MDRSRCAASNRGDGVEAAYGVSQAGGDCFACPFGGVVGVGSEAVAEVTGLVLDHRLVTLTGPAGVGKSRLALQAARSLAGMPPPILVDLATVTAGSEVDRAFSNAIGLVEDDRGLRTALRDALRGSRHWLVVDNCEHVRGHCAALLGDLLSAAAELRVLTTSRSSLRVAGEVVREVEPLDLPAYSDDPAAVLDGSAGRLFADRAATASPGYAITACSRPPASWP